VSFLTPGGLDATTNQIKVTGKGTTTADQIIGPWATTGTATNAQTDYAVYSSDNVLAANIAASAESTWTTSANSYTLGTATTLSAARTITALRYTGTAGTLALGGNNLQTNGILNASSGLLTISGSGTVRQNGTTAGNLYINANKDITISSTIANNTGKLTLVKTGAGTLTLSGTTTYTGDTIVLEGTLQPTSSSLINGNLVVGSIGGGPAAVFANTTYTKFGANMSGTVYSNGSLNWSNSGAVFKNLTIIGGTANSNYGYVDTAVYMTGGTLSGTLWGQCPSVITYASSSTATISAGMNTWIYGDFTYNVADGAAVIDLNHTGGINLNKPQFGIVKSGAGTMAVGTANSFTGATTVSGGTLLLTHSNALATSPLANGGTGIVFDSSVTSRTFQIGGLNGSGNLALQDNAATSNAITLVLSTAANTSRSYAGNLSGAGNVTKIGTGTQIFTASSSYTGTTALNNGVLQFAALNNLGGAAAPITFAGGTLRWATGNLADISSGRTVTLNAGGAIFDTNGNNVTFANAIGNSGVGGLTKAGAGILTLSGANNYTGSTLVSAGTLAAGNANAFGNSTVTVNGGVLDLRTVNVANVINITGTNGSVLLQSSSEALASNFAANSNFRGWQRNSGLTQNSQAQFLGGANGLSAATVTSSWAASTNTSKIVSDVLDIKGINGTTFVLQMNYAPIAGKDDAWETQNATLGWLNSSTQWVNAVLGNNDGTGTLGTHYTVAYDPNASYNLGDYGVDAGNNVVWAVVNHNSEFAVVVPEPAALALFALGGLALLRRRRCETV